MEYIPWSPSDYEDYEIYMKNKKLKDRDYCKKHLGSTINPKHGKCFLCRVKEGELVRCKLCEENYHSPDFDICYSCSHK